MVNSETNSALHAVAHGRVQGVNYRYFVFKKARQLQLTGFVRNLPSLEDVEVIAEGKKENLEKLLGYLHQGPTYSKIDRINVNWVEPSYKYNSFEIL